MKRILLVIASLISMPVLSEPVTIGSWTYKKESNKLTDRTDFLSTNRSTNSYSKNGRDMSATLVIRCSSDNTNLFISTDDYLGASSPKISVRLDNEKPVTSQWNIDEKGGTVFTRKPIGLIKDLTKHKKLVIGFETYGSTMESLEFDLSGIDSIAQEVSTACGWTL